MQEQNLKTHRRIVPVYHLVLWTILLAISLLATINLVKACEGSGGLLQAVLFLLITIALVISSFLLRSFPLIAQDRAIRAEENLRHFSLTGKLLDSRLTIAQIIALRFAQDAEFIALADRALKENLSSRAIKKSIRDWKADHHRA